jgi:ubiquitin-like-conjugating enzyme ATG3
MAAFEDDNLMVDEADGATLGSVDSSLVAGGGVAAGGMGGMGGVGAVGAGAGAGGAMMTAEEPADTILHMRRYDLSITYDKYYQTPRVWLVG